MAEKDVELGISADETGLTAALGRAEAAVKRSAGEMKASMDRFGQGLASIQKTFLAFTAVLAGGEAIKGIIKSAGDWQTEALKLSKALGVSTEQASVYQVALHHIGLESDVMIGAASKMSKQIYANGDAFTKLGVQTRDTQGHFRPLADVMSEVNAKLLEIKNPIEQNIAGQQVYGKGWLEIKGLLKLTAEQMAHAEERATALGLKVGPEGAAMARSYKEQLADVELVGKSLTIQMGNRLLPVFTQVGAAFSQAAPAISEVFGGALKFIAKLAIGVGGALEEMGLILGGVMAAAAAALTGDFSGARTILHELGSDLDAVEAKAKAMQDSLDKPVTASAAVDINSGPAPFEDKDAGQSRMGRWEEQLTIQKASYQQQQGLQGHYQEFSLQQEAEYWRKIHAQTVKGSAEDLAVQTKIAAATIAIGKQKFEAEAAALKAQEAEYKSNADAKLAIAQQLAAKMRSAYGEDSKQYQEAAKHVVEIELEKQQQLRQIQQSALELEEQHQLAVVDMAQQEAQALVQMGGMTSRQLLDQEQQFEQRRFQIRQAALRRDRDLLDPAKDPVAYKQASARIEALEIQHQGRMRQIVLQTTVAAHKPWTSMMDSITGTWAAGLSKMMRGQMTFSDGIRGALRSIGDAFEGMVSQAIVAMIRGFIQQKLLHKDGVMLDAKKAASGAFSAVAGIPYVGPFLAPVAAATAFTATMAFAERGYDVPAGVNPVTQLHQKEMVLPADIAEPLRKNIGSGRGLGGRGDTHIHALDTRGVTRALAQGNGSAAANALRLALRNRGLSGLAY